MGGTGGNPRELVLSNGIRINVPTIAVKDANGVYPIGENRVAPDQRFSFINDGSDNVLIEAFRQLGVNISPTPNPNPDPGGSGGGGCNAGIGVLTLALLPLLLKKRRQ